MKTWIIELPDNKIPSEYCGSCDYAGTRNCESSCSDWPMKHAREAILIEPPMQQEFHAVMDKQGHKTDWTKVKLYSVEEKK